MKPNPSAIRIDLFCKPAHGFAMGIVFLLTSSVQSQTPVPADHAKNMAAGIELFKSSVRPTLIGRCLKCHGDEKTEGDLDLSTRESLMAGGASQKAIDLNSASSSLLVKLIRHAEEPVMPEGGAKLDERQIQAIEKWIALGAPYDRPLLEPKDSDPLAWTKKIIDEDAREFWSLQPLKPVEPPTNANDRWSRNELDRFIWKGLSESQLSPNAPAESRTLIRRAFLDAIGLPPTAQQAAKAIDDLERDRWEAVVDSLLANPHFGERFARHWLDLARFAESFGFEQDYDRPHAYHYRDFVIRAFNQDLPYDQFVAWQIAGDELRPNNPDARMATGFLGAGVFPTQLTEKEFESARYDELDDMVATVGTAFLGFTLGCARCHDHKFDPIPSRDYYQLVSVFQSTIRSNVEIQTDPIADQARMEEWTKQHTPLESALSQFEAKELPTLFDAMLDRLKAENSPSTSKRQDAGWQLPASMQIVSEAGTVFTKQADGSFIASGTPGDKDIYVCVAETLGTRATGLRLDAINDPSFPRGGPGRASNGNFALSRIQVTAEPLDRSTPPVTIKLVSPVATFEQNNSSLSIASSLDENDSTGWAIDPQMNKPQSAAFRFEKPVEFAQGIRLHVTLVFRVNTQHTIGRPRISIASEDSIPSLDSEPTGGLNRELQSIARQPEPLTASQRQLLIDLYKTTDTKWVELKRKIDDHLQIKPKPTVVTAMVCGEGVKPIPNHGDDRGYPHFYPKSYFLKRGDVNQKQGEAEMGFVQALTRVSASNERNPDWSAWRVEPDTNSVSSYRRASFAKWITDTEHGAGYQLARVMVNRLWQYHFGQGLVATSSDFGFQGERPSNSDLLDWLAQRLIQGGWRLKPIHKLIMTSATYRQSSHFDEAKSAIDPKNHRLWRFTPRRLEAEIIRDSVLAATGQLDPTMFGPGTLDESMKRRSIYFFVKRSQLIPFMQVFDSPEPLVSVGQRPSTTIAPQALMFMNNSQVRGWAQGFAKRVLEMERDSLEEQIRNAYRTALTREPRAEELEQAVEFLRQQMESYAVSAPENKSHANEMALADLCQILISLTEFIYLD